MLRWANGSGSDLVAVLHAYNAWYHSHNTRVFGTKSEMKKKEREWCDRFSLDIDALHECYTQVNEIKSRLERLRIIQLHGSKSIQWNDNEKSIILKVVITGAFYPNLFARTSLHKDGYIHQVFKTIGGHDPRNTVYYTGFDRQRIRCLYSKSIKNIFIENDIISRENEKNIKVTFDCGANKTFVSFKTNKPFNNEINYENGNDSMPGKISTEVYKSIKMRDLRIPSKISIMK